MKFGQLIEYIMKKCFHQKSCTNCDEQTFPRPFPIKSKLSISLDQQSKILQSPFLLHAKLRAIERY